MPSVVHPFRIRNFCSAQVVYRDLSMIQLKAPYVAGFLAFREADFLVEKVKRLQVVQPELAPQAIIVDGNGTLHPKGGAHDADEEADVITVSNHKTQL